MANINRLPKFKSEIDLSKVCEETNKYFTGWLIARLREEDDFDKAWDKRAKEVAELERLYGQTDC